MAKKSEKTVVLLNVGQRVYTTSAGDLVPGGSVEVPEKEATSLLDYRDIRDAAKVAPAIGANIEALQGQLDEANAKIQTLTDANVALTKELDEAKELIAAAK